MKLEQNIPCPSCGQIGRYSIPEEWTEQEQLQFALEHCKCPAGRSAKLRREQIDDAQFNLEQLCGEVAGENGFEPLNDADTFNLLKQAIELAANVKILSLSVKISGGGKVNIKLGTKGQIKVERKHEISASLGANQKY